jgi:hypothetical protein
MPELDAENANLHVPPRIGAIGGHAAAPTVASACRTRRDDVQSDALIWERRPRPVPAVHRRC